MLLKFLFSIELFWLQLLLKPFEKWILKIRAKTYCQSQIKPMLGSVLVFFSPGQLQVTRKVQPAR
jgi:hypothetical protein